MEKYHKIRVFIKVHKVGKSFGTFTCMTTGEDKKKVGFFASGTFDKSCSLHHITLEAIKAYLADVHYDQDTKYTIAFYTDCDEAAYEWTNEYLKEGKLSSSTKDQDLFAEIINLANRKKLKIGIYGNDSVLSSMKKVIK